MTRTRFKCGGGECSPPLFFGSYLRLDGANMDTATILAQLQSGKISASDAVKLLDAARNSAGGLTVKAVEPMYGHAMVELGGNVKPKKLSAKLLGQVIDPAYKAAIEAAIAEANAKAAKS